MRGRIGIPMRYKGFIVPRAGCISRLSRADVTRQAKIRLSWMDYYKKSRNARLTCRKFGISPDTFYRWKKRYRPFNLKSLEDDPKTRRPGNLRIPTTPVIVVNRILSLREMYPRWGKEKIAVLLKKEGHTVSVSTVGRTIRRLKDRGVLKEPKPNYISTKKRYLKRAWALRKPEQYQVKQPGDLVQVDTLDVRPIPGVVRKQFTARDTISKWDVLEAYGNAKASLAAKFLNTLITRTPFPVRAIQIDGGSEFKGEFEAECEQRRIALFVLPPRRPDLNGCVERSNRTHTEEFYEVNDFPFDLPSLNTKLREWEDIYNTVRPHQALGYLTPLEYITKLQSKGGCVRDLLD